MKNAIDDKDSKILRTLKEDSRLSIREIAKKTNLRPSTIHKRIARLKEEEVIQKFTVKLDDEKMGEGFIVFMFVKTKPSTILDNYVLKDGHIKEVYGVTGEYDLLIKLKFRDVGEFNDFLLQFRKEQKIEETLTMVVTALIKE